MEESAEDLFENAPCGYVSTLPDGTIIKLNSTLLKWTGYSKEELIRTKKVQTLFTTGGKIFFETHHAPLLRMQGFTNELNYSIFRKDRTSFPALVNSVLLKDKEGKPMLIRFTIFNITDRKKYEAELLHARKKAEEATRVKTALLSTISHEIRTPLNAVIGLVNLLKETGPTPEQTSLLNVLQYSSGHLLSLINDVLDLSRIESGKIELEEKSFPIRELIFSVLASLRVTADEKGLALHTEIDERIPVLVLGDPVKITQVLTNLIGNALKFTHQGSVKVALEVKETVEEFLVIDFSVIDTGIGIHPEKQQQIFEEFEQAGPGIREQFGGTGLGLSISRKLLQLYGSTLAVESEPGKGSRFFFRIGLKKGDEAYGPPAPAKITADPRALQGKRLLVAEDSQINVFVLSQFLTKWGAQFDVAANGVLAVEKVIQKDYDLVLMDLQMPEMDGYEATEEIRRLEDEKYRELPVIAFSAESGSGITEKIRTAGFDAFFSKPFDPEELLAGICACIAGRQLPEMSGKGADAQSGNQAKGMRNGSQSPSSGPVISMKGCIELAGHEPKDLTDLIIISAEELESYREEFRTSFSDRDSKILSRLAHRIKAVVHLLEAHRLGELIQEGIKIVEHQGDEGALGKVAGAVDQELMLAADELRSWLRQFNG
jgi:PAS domain S-box-containing protein